MSPPRTTVLAVLGAVILQLAAARDALKVAAVQPERGAKSSPRSNAIKAEADVGYYSKYYFATTGCDESLLISADVMTTGQCIAQTDNTYVMYSCGLTGLSSALYSDATCETLIEGSEDTKSEYPMNQCTDLDGSNSVKAICETTLEYDVAELSHVYNYLHDEDCSEETQIIESLYFVANQCFDLGNGKSRAQFCSDQGVAAYVYGNSECNPADITGVTFGVADTCQEPTNNYGNTTDIDKQVASAYQMATCNAPSGLPNYEDIGYYSTYFFAGTDCDSSELVSTHVVTTGECVKQTDSTYLKYFCDGNGLHSALYSDNKCSTIIPGSESAQKKYDIGTCSAYDGAGTGSVLAVCETELQYGAQYLSKIDGYLADDSCSDETPILETLYVVTDKCFDAGNGHSRAQFCSDQGAVVYYYNNSRCSQTSISSVAFSSVNECNAPSTDYGNTSDISKQLVSTYRFASCNSTGGLPDYTTVYYSTYYFANEECDGSSLVAADVVVTGGCSAQADGTWLRYSCDNDGLHSTQYSDILCTKQIAGSKDTKNDYPVGTCIVNGTNSIQVSCDVSLHYNAQELSRVDGYLNDDECSDEGELISEQFFATNECFDTGNGHSRAQFCSDQGISIYTYSNSQCNPSDISSVSFNEVVTCLPPTTNYGDTTDIDKQLISTYRTATCNSVAGLPSYEEVGYYSSYFFAGTDCDAGELVSADVVRTGECVKFSGDTYLMYFCDGNGLHSALYSDDSCHTLIPDSESVQKKYDIGTCTAYDGVGTGSVLAVCETELQYNVEYLSQAVGYFADKNCSSTSIETQYFTTEQCFDAGNGHSRAQFCSDDAVVVYFYDNSNCNPEKINSIGHYTTGACEPPAADYGQTTDISKQLLSTYRVASCNSTSGVIPTSDTGYLSTYYFAAPDCDDSALVSASVITTGVCSAQTDSTWVQYTCDDTGLHSAQYSDSFCLQLIQGSKDTQLVANMGTCTNSGGSNSVKAICESKLEYNVDDLSHVSSYLHDEECSDAKQIIQEQFFVANECFDIGNGQSRAQFCSDQGVVAYVYDNSQCNPADITETNFGVADVCKVPTNDYGDTTDIDKQIASAYRLATCNAPSGLPNYEDIGYYSTYFFAGTECDSNELVSVDVVTTGECIQQTDSTYLKYFCDGNGLHSALYSDNKCSTIIPGSESAQKKYDIGTCSAYDGEGTGSVLAVCETELQYGAQYLSNAAGYLDDSTCKRQSQIVERLYVTTDKCFDAGNGHSRAQFCSEDGAAVYFYGNSNCDSSDIDSVYFYLIDNCKVPGTDYGDTTDISKQLLSTYRLASCNSTTQNLPDYTRGYFTTYYFSGDTCDKTQLAYADATLTGECVAYGDSYTMFSCDDTGLHSALYSDSSCVQMIPGTKDTAALDGNQVGKCNSHGGSSVKPVCETTFSYNVDGLAHANGYLNDATCSEEAQLVQEQYFVTDTCFGLGGKSRLLTCDSNGVSFNYFIGDDCTNSTGQAFTPAGTCSGSGSTSTSYDTDVILNSAYRTAFCGTHTNGDDDEDDDDNYGGLSLGGFIGVVSAAAVILLLGIGYFIRTRMNHKDDTQSLLKNADVI